MAESNGENQGRVQTNRRNFALVLERDPNAQHIKIASQAVVDYRDGLTPFQQEPPFDAKYGCLVEGRPIFYVPPTEGQMVQYFGHAPFSRIAASISETQKSRAVTPSDFIPAYLRENPEKHDFAEAIFGYVQSADAIKLLEKKFGNVPQGDPRRAYAGRISVTDARMVTEISEPYEPEITSPILGSPKPTTFQHYLEQPQGKKTQRRDLHHYDTKDAKGKPSAHIRGHKLYWRQRMSSGQYCNSHQVDAKPDSKQHTRLKAVKPNIQFKFRVNFENLTDIELGALAWVLALGSEQHHPNARHMLGMGKPLGMGVVKLDATLMLRDRKRHYMSLFSENGWSNGDESGDVEGFIQNFVEFISSKVGAGYQSRMQELLTMLEGRDPNGLFTYMTIEPNEFKTRPVLPYPTEVIPSPEMLAKLEEERLRQEEEQRQAEEQRRRKEQAEREKADKRARGIEVGDEIAGEVFDVSDSIWFTPDDEYSGDREYEAQIPPDRIQKRRKEGERVSARVIEVKGGNPVRLICEQILKDKKK